MTPPPITRRAASKLAKPIEVAAKGEATAQDEGAGRHAVAVCLSSVEPEQVRFLWRPYLPLGKLAIFEGAPGDGKTFLALAIAAAVSRGWALPGDDAIREPGAVLYMTAEDGLRTPSAHDSTACRPTVRESQR